MFREQKRRQERNKQTTSKSNQPPRLACHLRVCRLLTGILQVGLLAAPSAVLAQSTPSDIESVAALHRLLTGEADKDAIEVQIRWLLNAEVAKLVSERDLPSRLKLDSEPFQLELQQIAAALAAEAIESEKGRKKVLLLVTTEGLADRLIAKHMGFEAPGKYLDDNAADKPTADLTGQFAMGPQGASLRLVESELKLLQEAGGPGVDNGILDAGEWVRLTLPIEHVGTKPFFSSSAWLQAGNRCVWVDDSTEYVLEEMAPGGGRANVEAWVYLSRSCEDWERASLRVKVHDTTQAKSRPEVMSIDLIPSHLSNAKLTNVSLDTDIPGWSDGSDAVPVGPGQHFEISADLQSRTRRPAAARMVYKPGELAGTLFAYQYRDVPMVYDLNSTGARQLMLAGDDLDLKSVAEKTFDEAMDSEARAEGWIRGERPVAWFAIDAELIFEHPADRGAAPPEPPRPVADPSPAALSDVLALVSRHVQLVPHATGPVNPESIAAADGFEIYFDRSAFTSDYNALVAPPKVEEEEGGPAREARYRVRYYLPIPVRWDPAPTSCEIVRPADHERFEAGEVVTLVGKVEDTWLGADAKVAVDWSSEASGQLATTTLGDGGRASHAASLPTGSHRVTMQALHNGTELCSAQVNLNIAPPRQAVAEPISEEPLDPLFRLDLGLHWVNAKTRDEDDRGLRWNSDRANLARVHARLTYGPQVRSTWLLGLKPPTSFQLRNSNSRIWQMLVGGGVAYSLELSEGVSAEPRVTTGLLLRGLTLDARNQGVKTSLFLMPGAALVLDLSDTMTAHASLDYELAPAWKPFDAKPNYWVLKGSGLRLGAGLSWRW